MKSCFDWGLHKKINKTRIALDSRKWKYKKSTYIKLFDGGEDSCTMMEKQKKIIKIHHQHFFSRIVRSVLQTYGWISKYLVKLKEKKRNNKKNSVEKTKRKGIGWEENKKGEVTRRIFCRRLWEVFWILNLDSLCLFLIS